jgi:hypothetical protein
MSYILLFAPVHSGYLCHSDLCFSPWRAGGVWGLAPQRKFCLFCTKMVYFEAYITCMVPTITLINNSRCCPGFVQVRMTFVQVKWLSQFFLTAHMKTQIIQYGEYNWEKLYFSRFGLCFDTKWLDFSNFGLLSRFFPGFGLLSRLSPGFQRVFHLSMFSR